MLSCGVREDKRIEVCRPLSEGGLGICSVEDTIFGLHGKLAWKILSQDSHWTRMLLQKYGPDSVYNIASIRAKIF